MKSDLVHSRVQMEPAILKNLVAEVKETVATDVVVSNNEKSAFGATKMWAIRRSRRVMANGRKAPRIVTGFGF